ncbi:MAG TPA: GNAT family N-acetyltransferase, partial [Pyrinomonadaceae bacterium]|nr:GNAT family N-acetyltransferase [Pyrinomonadaceae bacterium]
INEMIFADTDLARRLELTEARSNAKFVAARAAMFPESGAQWIEVAGALAMFDGVESPCTQTFGLGFSDNTTEEHLETLEAFFKERGAPVFHEISPLADSSLLPLLKKRGYQPIEFTSVMYRPIEGYDRMDLPENLKVGTRITQPGEEKLWARTSARGWSTEAPGLSEFMFEFGQVSARCALSFLAEKDGLPIGTGGLFVEGDTALLAGASTVPEGRKQGAQLALLDARLRYAARHGCTIAMMGASPGSGSQRNAERNGFRIAYTRIKWQLED